MLWLFTAARRCAQLGILGMNHRNAACILDHNLCRLYPLVDDKLRMDRLCRRIGVPTPQVYAVVESYSSLRRLADLLGGRGDFVVKPNHGSAGRGVLVLTGAMATPSCAITASALAWIRCGNICPTSSPECTH